MLLIFQKMKKTYKKYNNNKMLAALAQAQSKMLQHLWVLAAVPYAATTFNSTRGASFWNAVTPFTPSAFWSSFATETAVPCAEQKSRNRRLTNSHT